MSSDLGLAHEAPEAAPLEKEPVNDADAGRASTGPHAVVAAPPPPGSPPEALTPAHVLALQRAIGNRLTGNVVSARLQRDPLKEKKDKFYENVAQLIIELAQERGITVEQAMFLVAQAQVEQGLDDPLKNRNRIFNAQATFPEEKDLKLNPREGITTKRLPSPEFVDGEWKVLESPFYVYDTVERSFDHFLERLEKNHKDALKVLKSSEGQLEAYARALKASGFATAPNYVARMIEQHGIVMRELGAFLDEKLGEEWKNIGKGQSALASQWDVVKELWSKLTEAKDSRQQSTDDAGRAEIEQTIADLEAKLKEAEQVLKEIEAFLADREEQVKKLTTLKESLATKATAVAAK